VIIEEWTVIESIVVGAVRFRVAGWGQYRHFVTIYGVTPVKVFHLIGHLKSNGSFLQILHSTVG